MAHTVGDEKKGSVGCAFQGHNGEEGNEYGAGAREGNEPEQQAKQEGSDHPLLFRLDSGRSWDSYVEYSQEMEAHEEADGAGDVAPPGSVHARADCPSGEVKDGEGDGKPKGEDEGEQEGVTDAAVIVGLLSGYVGDHEGDHGDHAGICRSK